MDWSRMAFRLPSSSPVAWLAAGRLTQQVLGLVLFAVLAPILGPRPYGLFSLAMVFISFCELVLIEGAAEALITVNALDALHASTVNLTNGATALVFALLTAALAPTIARLFDDPEMARILWVLAPLPVLSALTATPIAILRRSLKYRSLAIRSIAGLTIGGIFGIVLAVAGAGVWALVAQALAQRLADLTIVWISVPIRLSFKWSRIHFREVRSVGVNVFIARIMIFFGSTLPRVILGYTLGPTEVGLFALAGRVLDIILLVIVAPASGVGRLELREFKPGSAEFRRKFAAMLQKSSVLSFPALLGTAAVTPDLFHVWLGERWQGATVATQLILLSGLPFVFFYCIDSALLAAKLSSVYMRLSAVQALTTLATVLCATPFGLNAVCLSLAIRSWVLLPCFLWLVRRVCHLPLYDCMRLPLRSLGGSIVMAGFLILPFSRPAWRHQTFDLMLLVILGALLYGVFLYWFSRGQLKALLIGFIALKPERRLDEGPAR
jgi:O-antigen/teichoic acid export membrane protein